jgi:dTDP-4-amino-4,6-dideoxygalactose transaminase
MATVSALVWLGIRPVFVDVDEETCNIDPEAAEAAITPRTTAIVAVHTFGNPSNIDALVRLAQRYDVRLVFDAAHGLGTLYQGKPVGAQGDAQVYSLSPTKLVVAGEGGIVATNDDALAERIRQGREYGMGAGYDSVMAGPNARLSEPHALLARRSLAMLDEGIARRHEIVEVYRDELERIPGIRLQRIRAEDRSSYKDFTIAVDADAFGTTRDVLKVALLAENIDTRNYYNPPVHRQSAYRMFAPPEESLVNTNKLCGQCITLPLWSMMEPEMARGICQAIGRIHGFAEQVDDRARAGALGIVI